MRQVNDELINACGMGSLDLEDFAYWDAWEDGISPKSTAQDALDNAGY